MHVLLQRQGANTFSSQFVLRRGMEDCISTMVGHCALNLVTPLRTVLQNFGHIQSRHYWVQKEKVGQTRGWNEPGNVLRRREGN